MLTPPSKLKYAISAVWLIDTCGIFVYNVNKNIVEHVSIKFKNDKEKQTIKKYLKASKKIMNEQFEC